MKCPEGKGKFMDYQFWGGIKTPEHTNKSQVRGKFELWKKLIIKDLEQEERYPSGRERNLHETMDKFNNSLFRNMLSAKANDGDIADDDEPNEDNFKRKFKEVMNAVSVVKSTMHQELV